MGREETAGSLPRGVEPVRENRSRNALLVYITRAQCVSLSRAAHRRKGRPRYFSGRVSAVSAALGYKSMRNYCK